MGAMIRRLLIAWHRWRRDRALDVARLYHDASAQSMRRGDHAAFVERSRIADRALDAADRHDCRIAELMR